MPESEPKPRLIELVDPGAGQGWKAVLKSGKSVVVHEIPVPPAEAAGAIPRVQRLFEHRHPSLSPVLAWGTDPNGLWVAVEPNEGVPLGTILSRGPLTPPAAAALGAALLSGVAALHEAGIAMGGFGAASVRVTGNGEARLAGHPAGAVRGAPSQSDLRADVRSSGMAICAAFGVDPAGAPAPPNIPPGLVVTMRSMASGAMGPAADRAQGALREMAAALLAPDRAGAAQAELALRAGGREMPPITPFLPQSEVQAPAAPEPAPYVPPTPREETPLPAAASYDAPPRAPEPKPSAPPTPSAYAPYSEPVAPAPPERPATIPPVVPVPFVTNPPAPSPFGTSAPSGPSERSPFGTDPPGPPPPETSAPTPPAPPPFAPLPFGTSAPAPGGTAPPAPSPFETRAPAPGGTAPPTPSPFGTSAPAAPTWEMPPASPPPLEAAPPPPPYVPPPVPAAEELPWPEPGKPAPIAPAEAWAPAAAAAAASTSAASTSPPAPAASEQTWSPVATPAWTPGEAPAGSPLASTRVPTVPPPTPARKPSVARPADREPRERPAWLVPAAIAIAVLLLLGIAGGVYLKVRPTSGVGPVGHASPTPRTSPKASPKVTPTPAGGPQAVPNYGPSAAAPVTGVAFCIQPDHPCAGVTANDYTNCKLNSSCKVMVEMKFSSAQHGNVAYMLKFFDRCTGVTTDLPGSGYTPPGYTRVDLLKVVTLPSAKSAALVAVTTSPAAAASAPLMLGGDTC